jgi:leucyl-tRNA synthetase
VTDDVESLAFNTAISAMMVFTNHLTALEQVPREAITKLTLLLSPFAPHLGEEMWAKLGNDESLAYEPWPEYDAALCEVNTVTMGVQVNGKVRGEIELAKDAEEAEARELALADEKVAKFVGGKEIKKFVYVPGRIVNIVVAK